MQKNRKFYPGKQGKRERERQTDRQTETERQPDRQRKKAHIKCYFYQKFYFNEFIGMFRVITDFSVVYFSVFLCRRETAIQNIIFTRY